MEFFSDLKKLGSWRLSRALGRGASSIVYMARHEITKVRGAAKVLVSMDLEGGRLERFQREAELAARIRHPHVVAALDAGREGPFHYIVYEFVDGENLGTILKRRPRLPQEAVLTVAEHIASALAAIHEQKLIHRDIKPDNILIDRKGSAKLADLGLGKDLTAPSLTVTDQIMGTPYYMAPEQAKNSKNVDHRADIYSLGATLYHALAGEELFTGDSALSVMQRHLTDPVFPLREKRSDLDPDFCAVVEKMLEKDPDKRFSSAKELLNALKETKRKRSLAAFPLERLVAKNEETVIVSAAKPESSGVRPGDTTRVEPPPPKAAGPREAEKPEGRERDREFDRKPSPWGGSVKGLVAGGLTLAALILGVLLVSRSLYRGHGTEGRKPSSAPGGKTTVSGSRLEVVSGSGTDPGTGLPLKVVNTKDGSELVLIPGGKFTMGSNKGSLVWQPPHQMELTPFYLGVLEVTNEKYLKFVVATGHRPLPSTWNDAEPFFPPARRKHPVAGIDWESAREYAVWAGLRLPTEAEWERAARDDDGRLFPWGNEWELGLAQDAAMLGFPTGSAESLVSWHLRIPTERGEEFLTKGLGSVEAGSLKRGASPYGCLNMAANVAEWTADYFEPYPQSPAPASLFPPPRTEHVIRGNSWWHDSPDRPAAVLRWSLPRGRFDVGFRVAATPPDELFKREKEPTK